MADAASDTGAGLHEADVMTLLARLTRKGAFLTAHASGYVVRYPGEPARLTAAAIGPRHVDRRVAAAALQRGWVTADLKSDLRLSETGALALRRGERPRSSPTPSALGAPPVHPLPAAGRRHGIGRLAMMRDGHGTPILTGGQREAGERLARDFLAGQMMPRVTANWDRAALGLAMGRHRSPPSDGLGSSAAAAQERVRRALADAGPEFADVLLDVCCLDVGLDVIGQRHAWPRGAVRVVLGLALDRLVRHYGVVASGPVRARTQSWSDGQG